MVSDESLGKIEEVLALEVLPIRTPEDFTLTAIVWALSSLEDSRGLIMMGLDDATRSDKSEERWAHSWGFVSRDILTNP